MAPIMIVMPEAHVNSKFWRMSAKTIEDPEDVYPLDRHELGMDEDKDGDVDWETSKKP
jgi:hypothetical protein